MCNNPRRGLLAPLLCSEMVPSTTAAQQEAVEVIEFNPNCLCFVEGSLTDTRMEICPSFDFPISAPVFPISNRSANEQVR